MRLGNGSSAGSMLTNPIDLSVNGGIYHVAITVKGWTNVEGQIMVTASTGSTQTKAYTATMASEFETLDFVFKDGTANTSIKIATTAKRAFIGSVRVYYIPGDTGEDIGTPGGDDPTPTVDVTGAGTTTSPYTVADVQALGTSSSPVWVKGYIVGYALSSGQTFADKTVFRADEAVASNILLADAADVNEASQVIPVQLPTGSVRTALNLADNPDNVGKQVWLKGDIATYFGVPGLKNTSEYSFTEPQDEQPVETVSTTADAHAAEAGTTMKLEGLVVAIYPNGFLLADAAGFITVYQGKAPEFALNDKVSVEGKVETYNGMNQFGKTAVVTKLDGTMEWTAPTATVLDATTIEALYANLAITYVEVTGTLTFSGDNNKYKNLVIEDAAIQGSLQITDAVLGTATNNSKVKVTGYYVWNSESKDKESGEVTARYANIIVTKVEVLEAGDEVKTLATIAELKDAAKNAPTEAEAIECFFNADNLLVAYADASNIYLTDGNAGVLIYNKAKIAIPEEIKTGNKVSFTAKGSLCLYHGQTELYLATLTDVSLASENNTIVAKEVPADELVLNASVYENMLVKVPGLVPSAATWDSQRIVPAVYQDENENETNIDIRDNFKTLSDVSFDTKEAYTVTGFFAPYDATFRLAPRTAEDIEGKVIEPEPYVAEGEGTEAKPYTVADVKGLSGTGEEAPIGWVRGFIVGYVDGSIKNGSIFSATAPEGKTVVASNILLAADAAETDVEKVVPVQLPTGDIRAALNLLDNPDNLGKEVLLNGTLTAYFGTAGVKTITDFKLATGEDAILSVRKAEAQSSIFTLAGQRVAKAVKPGLYIMGGRKVVIK